ncbi:MAG: DUF1600 domain-containing protein [Mycoplasmataceae bacterium]|nr:DUF1600 domain-containing protein [Mycoplasmataceae bacterium]
MFYSIIFAGEGISAFPLGTALWWVQSCILHILCPILFITFFALNIWVKKIELYNKIHYKSAVLGIILPAVYMVYLVITFFTMHYSQYGDLSAFWDFADIKNPSQVVDHSIHGSWAHLFFLPLFLTASWGALTLFYFMFNKFKQAL